MENGPSVERRLQSKIPRKPVGGHRATLSVPIAANPGKPVNDDGVSLLSRSSFVDPEWMAIFNFDTRYPGNDIGEQGIPLMRPSAQEAEIRRNSYIPSQRASLVESAERWVQPNHGSSSQRGIQPTHGLNSERGAHSAYDEKPRTRLPWVLRWLSCCLGSS
jgi:hypothetical protein